MATDKAQFAKQLGHTIAIYRQEMGLTQEQIAEILGIGSEAISRIERGVAMPTLVRLIEFADVFKCSVADLMTKKSKRSQDKARYIFALLNDLEEKDQKIVLDLVETLSQHLKER